MDTTVHRNERQRLGVSHFAALITLCLADGEGLRIAMIVGGAAQLSGASYAWLSTA